MSLTVRRRLEYFHVRQATLAIISIVRWRQGDFGSRDYIATGVHPLMVGWDFDML
jgi:hypothetical protein